MLKKFLGLGITILLISAVKAHPFLSNEVFSEKNNISILTDELSARIASNSEFRLYYISCLEFGNSFIESKAGILFEKYVKKTATKDEENVLFRKFNCSSKEEFDAMGNKLKIEFLSFAKKFPEWQLLQEKERKEVLINAMKTIKLDNAISTKFTKVLRVTYYDCFSAYIACFAGCIIACAGEPNNTCVWVCEGFCAAGFSACYVFAES